VRWSRQSCSTGLAADGSFSGRQEGGFDELPHDRFDPFLTELFRKVLCHVIELLTALPFSGTDQQIGQVWSMSLPTSRAE
jgi:hypothetical protein